MFDLSNGPYLSRDALFLETVCLRSMSQGFIAPHCLSAQLSYSVHRYIWVSACFLCGIFVMPLCTFQLVLSLVPKKSMTLRDGEEYCYKTYFNVLKTWLGSLKTKSTFYSLWSIAADVEIQKYREPSLVLRVLSKLGWEGYYLDLVILTYCLQV